MNLFEQPTENKTYYTKGTLIEIPSGARLFIIDQDHFGYYLSDKPNGILRIGAIPESEVKPVNWREYIRSLRVAYFCTDNDIAKMQIDVVLQALLANWQRVILLRESGCQCYTPQIAWLIGVGPKCEHCGAQVYLDNIEGEQ